MLQNITAYESLMHLEPIGTIHTPYDEKFAVPRQPGLIDSTATITFNDQYAHPDCFRGIEQFSHLWLVFQFHQTAARGWKPLVRPPRLGGNQKMGVFATRSSHRPNNLGLSVVLLNRLDCISGKAQLQVEGADLVDGTPILDIKPYIPYSDAPDQVQAGFADKAPTTSLTIDYTPVAKQQLARLPNEFRHLVQQVLAQDPRPAYQKQDNSERVYGVSLSGINVRWQVLGTRVLVLDLKDRKENSL